MVINRKGEDMSDNNLNDMPDGMDAGSTGQYGQEQFGQQTSGQYGQQFDLMAQNSMYDQTVNMYGDQAHRPETPQKQRGIKIAIIAVVAALVVIAALVVVFMVFVKKTPKEAVKSAMENTAKELENNNIAGVIGIDDIDADKLDVQSVVCHHDIGWLQVAVDGLLVVDILQHVLYLGEEFSCQRLGKKPF